MKNIYKNGIMYIEKATRCKKNMCLWMLMSCSVQTRPSIVLTISIVHGSIK